MTYPLSSSIDYRDEITPIIYLEIPPTKVVLFQAFFELYEGLGLVRTLDMRKNLICVITMDSQLAECCNALEAIKSQIDWKPATIPSLEEKEKYLGFFKNTKK
jgi:hypothetical protein